jgi:hypothetical protein
MGFVQAALVSGLGAVGASLLGVVLATRGPDPAILANADASAAALAALLSAPEPSWWHPDHGSVEEMQQALKRWFPNVEWGQQPEAAKNLMHKDNFAAKEANKERLRRLERTLGLLSGAVRGLQIHSLNNRVLGDHSCGARIRPQDEFRNVGAIGDVQVGRMTATLAGQAGTFPARVYMRPYLTGDATVGAVYVILAESALEGSGGGMWVMLTPLLVAVAAGFLLLQANRFAGDAKALARDLDQIGRGKLDLRVAARGGEIGLLARTTDRMAKNLQTIATTGTDNLDEALEKELDTATQIHQSLRPQDPPRVPGYELETLFKAGRDIGGDYYDYIELDANRLAVVLADCSENLRGVPAAMVMAMTRAYLKASIDPRGGPGDWLRAVNRRLARDLRAGMSVTALVVVLDSSSHEATAVSAGHRPLVLWRAGKTATINPNGIALGLDVGPVFDKTLEEKRFSIEKNDRLVLYTDGVVSAKGDASEAYGEARFLDAVRRQGAMNSAAFVNFIAGGVDKYCGEAGQDDDITVCTLKRMK